MKLGAVVVTYNRIDLLKECLEALKNQTASLSTVIVVDNASTDGTDLFLQEEVGKWPALVNLRQEENLGGAGGFYQALKEAKKYNLDYIIIIDDDAILSKTYMERILHTADKHPHYQAFAGAVYTDKKIDVNHRRRVSNRLIFIESFVPLEEYKSLFRCDAATFCGLVIKGQVLEDYGLPNKEYFIWYDDSEFCLRLKDKGGVLVNPKAKLNHKTKLPEENETLLMRTSWRHYYGYRNRYDCGKKHFGNLTGLCILLEYHVLRFLSLLMIFSSDEKKKSQGHFNLQMIGDAIRDGKASKLGFNDNYRRG